MNEIEVRVSTGQRAAAQLMARLREAAGQPVPPALRKIAEAQVRTDPVRQAEITADDMDLADEATDDAPGVDDEAARARRAARRAARAGRRNGNGRGSGTGRRGRNQDTS